ncbi:hypothetical protein LWF01_09300 [Saxibacter everestensis]|uniref:LPXTG-motif cell wall anchor domain-containing protein n=1 Tax=Saxibacter everestensis TaxID=2909229 RepID=A0ABY8QY88_9MICO|nr:hypothetical protein LWF01_09300 [Brevibacteriaceae bacterium ZFBP1038]
MLRKRSLLRSTLVVTAAASIALGGTTLASAVVAQPADATTTASAADSIDPQLAKAIKRDLGISVDEYLARGETAEKISAAKTDLEKTKGFDGVWMDGNNVTIGANAAAGADLKAAAKALNAKVVKTSSGTQNSVDAAWKAIEKEGVSVQSIARSKSGLKVTVQAEAQAKASKKTSIDAAANEKAADEIDAKKLEAKLGTKISVQAADYKISPAAANDLPGGHGYITSNKGGTPSGICSAGFNGFDKDGKPVVITAGHCNSGKAGDPAAYGQGGKTNLENPAKPNELTKDLGAWGPSIFAGAYNGASDGDTDIGIVTVTNGQLNPVAKVTDWKNKNDLASSGPNVNGVVDPTVGAPVCKSGRTTFWTCDKIDELLTFEVGITPTKTQKVEGFRSNAEANAGDSGGSQISGTNAVGITSAVANKGTNPDGTYILENPPVTFATGLKDALGKLPSGYTVKQHVATPTVTTKKVESGGNIKGTAPKGSTVVVTAGGQSQNVDVDGDGNWTIKAPNALGDYNFSVKAKKGFNESASVDATVKVVAEVIDDVTITTPKDGSKVSVSDSKLKFEGEGENDAAVKITDSASDVTASATVKDGKWTAELSDKLKVGEHKFTATQTVGNETSTASVTVTVTKDPAAKVTITSPEDGQKFQDDDPNIKFTGAGEDGADIKLSYEDGKTWTAKVTDGAWEIKLGDTLKAGEYTFTAAQTVDGEAAGEATVDITVAPAADTDTEGTTEGGSDSEADTEDGTDSESSTEGGSDTEAGTDGEGSTEAGTNAEDDNGDDLPRTGFAGATAAAIGGGLLIAFGALTLIVMRRREMQ